MRPLRILTWAIHGGYLNALAQLEHELYLPVDVARGEGYGGAGGQVLDRRRIREAPAGEVRGLPLDLVLHQSSKTWREDRHELLSPAQQRLPQVYIEHNVPKPHAVDSRHPVDDPDALLVHVTQYNRLMWDNGRTPTVVVEHAVAIAPGVEYGGELARGISVVNSMPRRGRSVGHDLFLGAREAGIPLDIAGFGNEGLDPVGNFGYAELHRFTSRYRFLFSPMRYTSLPLAVVEALHVGMPVVALATTEPPTVIEDGVHGYVSCDLDYLHDRMSGLLRDPMEARRLGRNARELARARFGLERFRRDWDRVFARALGG